MFDVDSLSLAGAMKASPNYKIIRSGPMIYVFPDDADFERIAIVNSMIEWTKKAVIVIDGDGNVRTNRYGKTNAEGGGW